MTKPLQGDDLAKLLLRLAVGGLMLLHGVHKVSNGIGGIEGMLAENDMPVQLAWGVYLGEVVAPILLLLGWMTRPAGLFVAFTMAFSMYLAYGGDTFNMTQHGGLATEVNWLYMIGALSLFLTGGGRFSVGRGEGRWS
jgi:putative oxidoreductase